MQPRPRTMSYRKPVPVYIPTPPPSPKDPVPVQAEPRVPEALHHDDVEQPQPPVRSILLSRTTCSTILSCRGIGRKRCTMVLLAVSWTST